VKKGAQAPKRRQAATFFSGTFLKGALLTRNVKNFGWKIHKGPAVCTERNIFILKCS